MKIYIPIATAAALSPTLASGYSLDRYTRFRRPILVNPGSVCTPGALMREQQALMNRAFRHSSPRYEITDNEEKFEIAIDVPGVKASDINVSIENDGQILTLSGQRESNKNNVAYSTKFSQSFTLDPAVDADKFSANLKNGVLIVSAPKDWKKVEDSIKTIPVTEVDKENIPIASAITQQPAIEAEDTDIKVETVEEDDAEEIIDVDQNDQPETDKGAEAGKV
jgi:HSP20 family protein